MKARQIYRWYGESSNGLEKNWSATHSLKPSPKPEQGPNFLNFRTAAGGKEATESLKFAGLVPWGQREEAMSLTKVKQQVPTQKQQWVTPEGLVK